jgi:hypothetical protein
VSRAPDNPYVHYYAAVGSAICGDEAAALQYAKRAVSLGGAADLQTNPDLLPLLQSTEEGRELLRRGSTRQS